MTAPSETDRLDLYNEMRTILTEESASTFMESLPPVPYPDLATKADLDAFGTALRSEMEYGLSGLRVELKDEMHAGFTRVDENMRTQLYWMIGTMITLFGVLAALIVTGV